MKRSAADLRRSLHIVLALIAFAIVLLPPIATFALALSATRGEVEIAARQQATLVGRVIARYPEVWKFATERLEEALVGIRDRDSLLVITNTDGGIVLHVGYLQAIPTVRREQPILAFGQTVGKVTLIKSLRPAFYTAVYVAAGTSIAGLVLMIIFLRLRRREIEIADARLTDAVDAAGDFAAVVREAMDPVILIDPSNGKLVDFNDAACALTGHSREALKDLRIDDIAPEHAASICGDTHPGFSEEHRVWIEAEITTLGREKRFVRIGVSTLLRRDKTYLATIWSDITALREQQSQLRQLAHFDALTQLPNRTLLADRMELALAQAKRNGTLLAIGFLDLDDFKPINDALGHAAGDTVLLEIANRLHHSVRAGDTVSRLGGDEFVIMMVELESVDATLLGFKRIMDSINTPMTVQGKDLSVSASIGVTFFPIDQGDGEQLMRHADLAMYQAKIAGKNLIHVFDTEDDRIRRGAGLQLQEIRDGLDRGEFRLYYQPKVNMRSGRVIGAEALLRWQHPGNGMMLPIRFLGAMENSALAIPVGNWVIDEAFRQIALWNRDGINLRVSVNVFARQLANDFVGTLKEHLARWPTVRADQISVEIVETEALKSIEEVNRVVTQCQALGVRFSIDDFGTGYSSLSYLRRLPAQTLKIDQSFVNGMLHNPEDLAITDGIIRLADAFGREVIAEGVEYPQYGLGLLMIGCEVAQGYRIAQPMPGEAIGEWVRGYKPPRQWLEKFSPLARNDFDLLAAELDLEIWYERYEAEVLNGPVDVAHWPALDAPSGRFSRWIDGEGLRRYGHLEEFRRVVSTCRELCEHSRRLVDSVSSWNSVEAQMLRSALSTLRDQLQTRFFELREARVRELRTASHADSRMDSYPDSPSDPQTDPRADSSPAIEPTPPSRATSVSKKVPRDYPDFPPLPLPLPQASD